MRKKKESSNRIFPDFLMHTLWTLEKLPVVPLEYFDRVGVHFQPSERVTDTPSDNSVLSTGRRAIVTRDDAVSVLW